MATLWADIQVQIGNQGYSTTGETAAVRIRTAIQAQIAANAMNAAANQPPDADNQQPGAINQPADAANQPAAAADQMNLGAAQ